LCSPYCSNIASHLSPPLRSLSHFLLSGTVAPSSNAAAFFFSALFSFLVATIFCRGSRLSPNLPVAISPLCLLRFFFPPGMGRPHRPRDLHKDSSPVHSSQRRFCRPVGPITLRRACGYFSVGGLGGVLVFPLPIFLFFFLVLPCDTLGLWPPCAPLLFPFSPCFPRPPGTPHGPPFPFHLFMPMNDFPRDSSWQDVPLGFGTPRSPSPSCPPGTEF